MLSQPVPRKLGLAKRLVKACCHEDFVLLRICLDLVWT
jgi:hypothetical protein